MRKFALTAAVAALSVASPALADIVVASGVNNQGTENVTFADQNAAATIFGSAGGQTNNFSVTGTTVGGGNLLVASGGGVLGSGSALTSVTLSQTGGSTFTNLVFNIDALLSGTVSLTVTQVGFLPFESNFTVDANGFNFFTVSAINGQRIQSATVTGLFGTTLNKLELVRFGPVAGGVPEPGTWAMMLLGFGGIGIVMRRRRKDISVAEAPA